MISCFLSCYCLDKHAPPKCDLSLFISFKNHWNFIFISSKWSQVLPRVNNLSCLTVLTCHRSKARIFLYN